jgi:hypothetical protein
VETAVAADTSRSTNLQLLDDVRTVLTAKFMKSADLCQQLQQIAESPWKQYELNPSRLGRRLREYGIKTRHSDDKSERGYHLEDFTDAFTRYLPPSEKVSMVSQGVPNGSDQHQSADTYTELKVSAQSTEGVPDTNGDSKASPHQASSEGTADALGHHGHLFSEQGPEPGNNVTEIPTFNPHRRKRTRGHFRPPAGPGRCPQCGWHIESMGHADDCTANEESA